MKCPYCLHEETKVVDTRESDDLITRRRRECLKCEKRFTTYERVLLNLRVIKKDGRREPFERNKLKNGILKACEKRPISEDAIENLIDEIEKELRNYEDTEINSSIIGQLVMKKLKKLDKIAYIRFASVYREFTDINSFEKELKNLTKEK